MSKATQQELAVANQQLLPKTANDRLHDFWKRNSRQIKAVMIGGDEKKIEAATFSAISRNPKLIECTPFSLLNGIVLIHQLGLRLGTAEVSLVPYGSEATVIIGYQGKIKLALMGGVVKSIEAELVYACDEFLWWRDENGLHFKHEPNWRGRSEAGDANDKNILGAYCQIEITSKQTRFCDLREILGARARSRGYQYQLKKGGTDNPWISDFGAMALKTAVHRALKLAPQDPHLRMATTITEEDEGGGIVHADGLSAGDFTDDDTKRPLLETGKDAAQQVAEEKLQFLAGREA